LAFGNEIIAALEIFPGMRVANTQEFKKAYAALTERYYAQME
jgi:hypothetical protein